MLLSPCVGSGSRDAAGTPCGQLESNTHSSEGLAKASRGLDASPDASSGSNTRNARTSSLFLALFNVCLALGSILVLLMDCAGLK